MALLIVNDWVVKRHWPGMVSGKLSDVAGLIFFPLLLVALVEMASDVVRRPWRASRPTFVGVAVVVGAFFAATKTVAPVREVDETVLAWLRWLPVAAFRSARGTDLGEPVRHQVVADLTDLLTVPSVLVAVWIGGTYRRPSRHEHVIGDQFEE